MMTNPSHVKIDEYDISTVTELSGEVGFFIPAKGKLDLTLRKIDRLSKGSVSRAVESAKWEELSEGDILTIGYPVGLSLEKLHLCKLEANADALKARKAGAKIAKLASKAGDVVLALGKHKRADEILFGFALRNYDFTQYKTSKEQKSQMITALVENPSRFSLSIHDQAALVEGVFFTRDLVSEPANILTTEDFAARLIAMETLGLSVEVLEEDELAKLGMNALLAVGQGSTSPSKVVIMKWNGGGEEAPLALVGKGVVFDTGGISLKPAAGMEDMTMDMGGAGVVAGVMRALALRKAKANVIGIVGLVENMPDGKAQRPGDIVKSMKGDTIEVINTDAEGRLVLCDVMWHVQEAFKPSAMIDLATLTGAVIIALGHENAGVFSNNNKLVNDFLKASGNEGEGAWHLPLGDAYAERLKSRIADVKNVGGRPAGSITAAQFLQRFVKDETPWIHLDIAGVASRDEGDFAPKGASGWGVLALNRLIADQFEGE